MNSSLVSLPVYVTLFVRSNVPKPWCADAVTTEAKKDSEKGNESNHQQSFLAR